MSRLVAFAADVGASWGLYTLGIALFDTSFKLVVGRSYNLTNHQVLALTLLSAWEILYFSYQWAVSGKTLGMALFGLQVVTAQGGPIGMRQAVVRTLALAVSLAIFPFGFLGIVFQRERRAIDDLVAGTAVVYCWDARAARLRWIARNENPLSQAATKRQRQEPALEHGQRAAS